MKTITSRRSLLRNSAATVAALGLGGKLVRAQESPTRIGVIYDLSGRSRRQARSPARLARRSRSTSSTSVAASPANTRSSRSMPIHKARRTSPSTRSSG